MYNVGDFVLDNRKNERVQIIEKTKVWGYISYKVYNVAENSVYKLPEEQIATLTLISNTDENYLRYVVLLAKIKNEIAAGTILNVSDKIVPLPHQIHVLNRAVSNNNIRYILADEVGLGKTIEAGMIIKELKMRGLIKRILIVCPKGLVTQWNMEMQEKFTEKFHVVLPEDFDTIRRLTDSDDVYGQFEQVISPMDSIKPLEKRAGWNDEKIAKYNEERIYSIINSGWDLIVIDEAHRVAGSSGEVARHRLGNLLSKASPYLLLLTATPHNGKTEPFLRLVRLVDEKAFPNFKAIVKEQVAPYLIRTEKREAIDNSGNKLFKNRKTLAINLTWDERHSLQKQLYELTSEYVARGYNTALRNRGKFMWFIFLLIMMQRLVTSSTYAIRKSLEKRIKVLETQAFELNNISEEEFAEMELEKNIDDVIKMMSLDIKSEIAELTKIVLIAQQAEFQYLDVKVEPLMEIIDNIFAEDKAGKVIIFTEFVATQEYLQKLLKNRGYTTSILNGSMSIDERNTVLVEFKINTNIFISTDAGGEGLNLQFANIIINYDLPWNPMKIEQRIGRVDRIGQKRDVIVYNFILADTVEKRVKDVLENKLSLILKEVGIDKYSDVLDNELSEMNFTDAYMKSIRNPKDIEYNLKPIEEDLKIQLRNANKLRDVLYEEKDLNSFMGVASNFEMEDALRRMVFFYKEFTGKKYLTVDSYDLNDVNIIKHLKKDFQYDLANGAILININDFPNEKGYFMLWELSLTENMQDKRIVPIFINEAFILRPMAGKKIWDELFRDTAQIEVIKTIMIDEVVFNKVSDIAREFAYDTFLSRKNEFEKKNTETYEKYLYALDLRIEAAKNIGIANIKTHKINELLKEKTLIEKQYQLSMQICPDFKPILMVYLE